MNIGSKVKNKICPTMIGTVKKLYGNGMVLIEINDKYLTTKELLICVRYWEMM